LTRERIIELRRADATDATLVELAELAAATRAAGDVEAAALARAIEVAHARHIGRHQHAVVAGAELLELWPEVRRRPVPTGEGDDKDELDLARRLAWGLKYVAGSAMDLPEIPLATSDGVLAVLGEVLAHYDYEPFAQWTLQARRAYIAGDDAALAELVHRLAPTVTRYNHVYECADCPGCMLLQFAEWLGPDASDADVEEVLAPCLGRKPYLPDGPMSRILDLLYGPAGTCENAERTVPVLLARAYLRTGRTAEALAQAERAGALAEGSDPPRVARALAARTAVIAALGQPAARELASELASRAEALEDAYEQLDALLVAHRVLRDAAIADRARGLARRLDARIERARHVAATEQALA